MRARIMIVVLFLIFYESIEAQQDAQFTQYMYNTSIINPAYAGSRGNLSANLIHRAQWVGLDGSPRTQTLTLHTPLGFKVGLGLSIIRDEIGPAVEDYIAADFSYTLTLNDNETYFAFGLKAGLYSLNIDFNKLTIFDPTDDPFQTSIQNRTSPMIGLGGYLYSKNWYVGISSPNVLTTQHYTNSRISRASETLHWYTIAGYVFELSKKVKFKPATLLKLTKGAPLAVDVSTNFLIHDKITLGASYRVSVGVSALVGFQLNDQIMLGYAYDYDTTDLGDFNSGSHEFFLRYELFKRYRGKISPRFF